MKKIFIIILCIGAGYILSGCKNTKNKHNLRIGIASGYAPFISLNNQGDYEGFDIDVISAVATNMSRPLELVDLGSMAPLFVALESEQVDALIWGLSITKERCNNVAMINYLGEATTSFPLLFWNNIPQGIRTINDMQGMNVCVEPGSAQESVLATYPFINMLYTERIDDALLYIQTGKADAALVEPAVAKKFKRRFDTIVSLELPLTADQQVDGIGIAVKKNNTALTEALRQTIARLKADGTINTFAQTWGLL